MRRQSWVVLLFVCTASTAWSEDGGRKPAATAPQEAKPAWHSQLQTLSWDKFIAQVPEAERTEAGKAWLAGDSERKRKIEASTLATLEKELSSAELGNAAYDRILVKLDCEGPGSLEPVEMNIHRVLSMLGKVSNSGLSSFFFQRAEHIDATREALAVIELPKLREAYEKALAALPSKPRMEALREVAEGKTDAARQTRAEWDKLQKTFFVDWGIATRACGDYLRAHLNEVQLPPLPARNTTDACYRSRK